MEERDKAQKERREIASTLMKKEKGLSSVLGCLN